MSEETVLVTGGIGFPGAYVVEDLLAAGRDVVAYGDPTGDDVLAKLGVTDATVRDGDVTDPADVIRAVRETGATRIVHLAALATDAAAADPRGALDVNVVGTNNVLEAARTLDDQVERVVWTSSAAVYAPPGNYDAGQVDEGDLVYPDTLYGATKEYCEHQARHYHEAYGLSLVGLRPTVVYGPYGGDSEPAFLSNVVEKPALGEPFAVDYGDQVIDWLHARDLAQAVRRAAFASDADLRRLIYNVRGELATVRDAVETIRSIVPDADLDVSDEGELPWTQNLDTTAIRRDVGYEVQYDLESGLRQYVDALRNDNGVEPART